MHTKSRVTRCRRVAPADLHPRPSPASEVQVSRVSQRTVDLCGMTCGVQEARGRGPMRISSRGTVTHCRSITATPLHFLIAILLPRTHGMYVMQPHLFFSSSSAPDSTRDFARIGDFLKSSMSSSSAQGGGVDKAASGRPQTQAGGYKVVAPWER
jgi:hypothetical protein